jgi:hypothetical protein
MRFQEAQAPEVAVLIVRGGCLANLAIFVIQIVSDYTQLRLCNIFASYGNYGKPKDVGIW